MTNSEKRKSNLELFRIISMIIIIAHHYVVNSGLLNCIQGSSLNDISILIFGWGGKTGINCFMMITGYFMCTSNVSLDNRQYLIIFMRKFLKLLLEVEFYNICIFVFFVMFGNQQFSMIELMKTIMPFYYINDGFTSCFLLFYLLIPFLGKLVQNLTEKEHRYLVFLLLLIYTVIPSLKMTVTFNYITWFSVIFIVASYLRLHESDSYIFSSEVIRKTRLWGILTLVMIFLSWASIAIIQIFGLKFQSIKSGLESYRYFFVSDSNKILAFATALCAFLFFKNVKLKYNKFINSVAASTFGVLTIHANSDAMRQWLWKDIFNNVGHYNDTFPYAFCAVLVVFCSCTVIDMFRIKFIEKPLFKVIDKKYK